MKEKIHNSIFVAAFAMFSSLPVHFHQYMRLGGSIFKTIPAPRQVFYLALSQSVMVSSLAFLCALVGFLYSRRLALPSFGKPNDFFKALFVGTGIGLVLIPVFYFLQDKDIHSKIPALYPDFPWALANMVGGSFTQEIFARFGLLTIGIYILDKAGRRSTTWPVFFVISLFASCSAFLTLLKFNLTSVLNPTQIALAFFITFTSQWVYCVIYERKGFLATWGIHIGISIKYPVYALFVFSG